jgi:tetratricopeptide (TPR) repeat protein
VQYRSLSVALILPALSLAAAPADAACKLSKFAELPVTMSGLRPMVPAKINGIDAEFVADSGAFYSVISPGSAAEFGLRTEATGAQFLGVGGSANLSIATVKSLTLAGQKIPSVQFIVGGSEVGVAGVLGQNILGLADVEYDLAGGSIRLFKPMNCSKAVLEYWSPTYSTVEISQSSPANRHTLGTAYLNGVKMRVAFDTGARGSILTLAAAARAGVKPGDTGVTATAESRGFGPKVVPTWIAPFASFKLGDEEVKKIHLRIGDTGNDDIDMLIGADFFLSHRVYVANSQHKLYFTYNGGPVFNLSTQGPADTPGGGATPFADRGRAEPTDAEGFSRRGAAFAARRDFGRAIADLSRACEMAPDEPRYFYGRALAYLGNKQPLLAMEDLDRALKFKPDDVPALMMRAGMRLDRHDTAAARTDLDTAAHAAAKEADQRLAIAGLYEAADAFDRAVAQYDLWIANHREDSRQADALNGRCWTRALWGQRLDQALADCDAALRKRPKSGEMLDSRGLVQLRLGNLDKAIADYDASLALRPATGWSLYGRGLARIRKGLKAEGEADLAAAIAVQPNLPERIKHYGIVPQGTAAPAGSSTGTRDQP